MGFIWDFDGMLMGFDGILNDFDKILMGYLPGTVPSSD